jgi:transcriptional regulator with XRE-family HTH domain
MDQEKIGKFILENRKLKKLTQSELAEKLGVTDRAVSNWENGKNMPDLSLFKPLCDTLDITINELISGEKIEDKNYKEKLEENIINTIDYMDKKKTKDNENKTLIILSIITICLGIAAWITKDMEFEVHINLVALTLAVCVFKRLVIRNLWLRKLLIFILISLWILTYIYK